MNLKMPEGMIGKLEDVLSQQDKIKEQAEFIKDTVEALAEEMRVKPADVNVILNGMRQIRKDPLKVQSRIDLLLLAQMATNGGALPSDDGEE